MIPPGCITKGMVSGNSSGSYGKDRSRHYVNEGFGIRQYLLWECGNQFDNGNVMFRRTSDAGVKTNHVNLWFG